MIIVRSPLRVTLGGGGTDIPSYYEKHGGFALAAAIDKYVYITLHKTFVDDLIVKYSRLERVHCAAELEHPIVREAMALLNVEGRGLEIASHADIPAGTGLGSSSAFTVALLAALHLHSRCPSEADLAELACHIELERLKEPIGKQDQYMAALGGIRALTFKRDEVKARPLPVSDETHAALEENLMLFFTGYTRSARQVLKDRPSDARLDELKSIAFGSMDALMAGDLKCFAEHLSAQWLHKRMSVPSSSNDDLDGWYHLGMRNGAMGGKLVGAGGGGFLMFYAEEKTQLRRAMREANLPEVRFRFDMEGTKVVVS